MKVLIVPYGIETTFEYVCSLTAVSVLIVPYGIETEYSSLDSDIKKVLIVPYGIETNTG